MASEKTSTAATLSLKRNELVTIETVELPRLYRSIGRRVAALPKVPPSLAQHVESVRRIESTNPPGADATPDPQRDAAYAMLGRAAVDQYGDKAIPKNIAPELTRLTELQRVLASEITALEAEGVPKSRWPRRLLLTAAGCACVAGVVVAARLSGVLSLAQSGDGAAKLLPLGVGSNVADASATTEELQQRLQIDREAVRAFEKAVVAKAETIKADSTKSLDSLRGKDSVSAIQAGYEAALASWKTKVQAFVAPIQDKSLLSQLSYMADKTMQREVLGEVQSSLEDELRAITAELAEQVESQKQSADYAFGGMNDLGKRFDRPAEERKQLISQSCSSLAVAFDNATTRIAAERTDAVRELIAKQERFIADFEEAEKARLLAERKAIEDAERAAMRAKEAAEESEKQKAMAAKEVQRGDSRNGDVADATEPQPAKGPTRVEEENKPEPVTWQRWLAFEQAAGARWQAESSSGANDVGEDIGNAIAKALGPVAETFQGKTFQGLTIGALYVDVVPDTDTVPVDKELPHLLAAVPGRREQGDVKPDEAWVLVDVATDKVVGIKVSFFAGPDETLQSVLDAFGKTAQPIEESTRDRGNYMQHWTTLRYTFPETIVRVQFLQMTGRFRNGATHIWVLDRKHVTSSMRAYANSLVTCCRWIKKWRSSAGPDGYELRGIPPLAGLKLEIDPDQLFARVSDPEQNRLCEKANREQWDWRQPEFLIAGMGTFNDAHAIVCDPSASAQVPMGKYRTIKPATGYHTLSDTPANDLLQSVASDIVQSFFQPSGDKIAVINEEAPRTAFTDIDDGIRDQVRGLLHVTLGLRHEWHDKDAWLVRVERSGVISLYKER